ncbi:MAG: amidohydrolase [Caulobacteraceae bacterium]|nr:amidohydrolase [Caulobacteraceae bacterium]
MVSRPLACAALALAALLGACASAAPPAPAASAAREPLPYKLDPYPSTYKPLPRVDTLIVGAVLLDGAGRRLDGADLLLKDGKVVAVGPNLARPAGVAVIDAHGRWVTPGVVDIHSHDGDFAMPMTANDLQTLDVSEISDPNDANVWAEHSVSPQDPDFSRALAGGVTTLQVLPGSDPLFGGRSVVLKDVPANTVQAMKFPGAPYGLKMACGENPKGTFGAKGRFPNSRMGEMAGYREAWLKARDYKAKWDKYERDGGDPPARDLKMDTLAGVLDGDIRVHMHCYKAEEMAQVIDLSHEMGYRVTAFHHAVEAYKIAPLLRREGICAVVWADWWGFKMEALDAIRENAAFLDAQGVCVTLHSDSPMVGQRLTVEAGKAMAAGRRAGLDIPPERAIEWVTLNPARGLGLDGQIGSLEPGKDADVVIWSGDPFSVYSKADQVFIDGALVFDRSDPARRPVSDFELGQPVLEGRP